VLVWLAALLMRVPSVCSGPLPRPLVDERQDSRLSHLNGLGIALVPEQRAERAENCPARDRCIAMVEGELEGVSQVSLASGEFSLHLFKLFFGGHRWRLQMGSAAPSSSRSFATERTSP
jgi:hypothetical protein